MSTNGWASTAFADPVRIERSRVHGVLNVFLLVLMGGLAVGVLATGGFKLKSMVIVGSLLGTLAAVNWLHRRAVRRSATVFDSAGVLCGDGRRLNWTEFKGVSTQLAMTSATRVAKWRIELVFASGTAWLIPNRIENWEEIQAIVSGMPVPHEERPA